MKTSLTAIAAIAVGTLAASAAVAASPGGYPRPGSTARVSVASNGAQVTYPASDESQGGMSDITADGRYVAFTSTASNIVPGGTKGIVKQVYRRDLRTGTNVLVSVAPDGNPGLLDSAQPTISDDGRYVAFMSSSPLVRNDTNAQTDIYRRDMQTGQTVRVSLTASGAQAENPGNAVNPLNARPSISADGQKVSFESIANNMAPEGGNQCLALCSTSNVFVRDLRKGTTTLVSATETGKPANGQDASISGNGRYVAFQAQPGVLRSHPHGTWDVYVRDLKLRKTVLASVSSDGSPARARTPLECGAGTPLVDLPAPLGTPRPIDNGVLCAESTTYTLGASRSLSDDGRYVVFLSGAENLVPNAPCQTANPNYCGFGVFVRDLVAHRTVRADVDSYGRPLSRATASGMGNVVSGNGRYVAYASDGGSVQDAQCPLQVAAVVPPLPVNGACTGNFDTYVYDLMTGASDWVSRPVSGVSAPGYCTGPVDVAQSQSWLGSLSDNGRYVSYYSSVRNLVAHDTNNHCDQFVRDRGTPLGIGGFGGAAPRSAPETPCVGGVVCPPPLPGGALVAGRVTPRPSLQDLFVRWDVQHLATVTSAPTGGTLYELHFSKAGQHYVVRAQRIAGPDFDAAGGASFGLFRESLPGVWTHIASLKGGYGTIGDSVVTAVPLSLLGGTAQLTDVTAYTAVGSYLSGPTKVLDSLRLSR